MTALADALSRAFSSGAEIALESGRAPSSQDGAEAVRDDLGLSRPFLDALDASVRATFKLPS